MIIADYQLIKQECTINLSMPQKKLRQKNREIKHYRPYIENKDACEIYQTTSLLEISISRGRCSHDADGSCIMCNYGIANKTRSDESYLNEVKNILDTCDPKLKRLMLCTNGSFFDKNQITDHLLQGVLVLASRCFIPNISFETYYNDVTTDILSLINQLLPDKKITIAMGLETSNQEYQNKIILKKIDLKEYAERIKLIHEYGFHVELNIMLGLPFLSTRQQFTDTCKTLQWVYSHKCSPVLFPVNIKPYTLLMEMYKTSFYKPITHWLVLEVLNTLTEDELAKIELAYYGNRIDDYDLSKNQTLFPICCQTCKPILEHFYKEFTHSDAGNIRKNVLMDAFRSCTCNCLSETITQINDNNAPGFDLFYNEYLTYLKN